MGLFSNLFGRRAKQEQFEPAQKTRAGSTKVRKYAAARPDRLVNFALMSGYNSLAEEARQSLRGLVAHSRDQSHNNDYLKAFYSHLRRNVVGRKGLQIKPQARFASGKLDFGANATIKAGFEEWGQRGTCTTCGKFSFKDLQRIAITSAARDGNFLARKYSGPQFGPFGFQLQVLDILMLDTELQKDLGGGSYIMAGVECNAFDRPVAYHIFKTNPLRGGLRGERLRIPAEEIVHLHLPYDQNAAVVGVPWAHTALRRLNNMGKFEEAALTNARWGASKMGFFTRDTDPEQEDGPTGHNEEGEGEEGAEPEIDEIEAGLLETLPDGYDFKSFDPAYPTGEMEPFVKIMLRGAAAGLDVSYATLANDLEKSNYSSLRAGLGEEREQWLLLQDWFADHFCAEIAPDWLKMALLTQKLVLPLSKFDKFNQIAWTGRGWRCVNPKDDAAANEKDMQNLVKSPQEVAAERGRNLEEIFDEFQEARALAKARGIDLDAALKPGKATLAEAEPVSQPEE